MATMTVRTTVAFVPATAILAGAELATTNSDDFQAFVPHGLKLRSI